MTHDYDISARGFTQRHYETTTNTTVHFEEDMPEDTRISIVVFGKPYTVSLADLKGMLRQREASMRSFVNPLSHEGIPMTPHDHVCRCEKESR